MKYSYTTSPLVCSEQIDVELKDGKIVKVDFLGGCPGSLFAIGTLVKGMSPEDAVKRLSGIKCADKPTSCPDQLAKALQKMIAETK